MAFTFCLAILSCGLAAGAHGMALASIKNHGVATSPQEPSSGTGTGSGPGIEDEAPEFESVEEFEKYAQALEEQAPVVRELPLPGIVSGTGKTRIVLAQDVNWPPYAFYNVGEAGVTGGLAGFGKDVGEGVAEVCKHLDITFVQTNWQNCWDPNGYRKDDAGIGIGLQKGWFNGCSTYTHAQGVRNRFVEFTNSILNANKPAGLLVMLNNDGTPKVDGLHDLAGKKIADVGGWVPTADGLMYVRNKCTGKKYSNKCLDKNPGGTDCYTLLVGDGNDESMKMLRNGTVDAMFVYADQAYNYQCDAEGLSHTGAQPTWDCSLWRGFGTEYAYVQTGQFGHAINGTTLALARKGSGLIQVLNPCIQKFMKTKEYYDVCKKHHLEETCYRNEFFPGQPKKPADYLVPTDKHDVNNGCSDGYCPCPWQQKLAKGVR